ncbi:hypothetical protein KsCSTR_15420 [Candidatus Kuenenia stuttgartiensis]|jgi:hypothetical protein|nr:MULTISPECIES: hypothetical protein [Kuenenia]MBE7548598.1 hypothetical protein [Planctomycetia bacterium]MBZ0190097.1 hypothetical protein [Candidatus Kuenenia stuttgartiensis]MCF6152244.1 hypothetical protein [Candidatus Kuenenia stuttgartiensis]MCL4726690.1 hypothetical protein [Candidatus Kuenenia stuttgartiensis]MCZ7621509.1 hypothetical protein [Candidatus Kuenenia sp.]
MLPFFKDFDKETFKRGLKHAFSVGTAQEYEVFKEYEHALAARLAAIIHKRRLTIPATMFLECMQPLNYIGSQAMVFLRPFLTFFFSPKEYDILQGILERRKGMKMIIEALENAPHQHQQEDKKKNEEKL